MASFVRGQWFTLAGFKPNATSVFHERATGPADHSAWANRHKRMVMYDGPHQFYEPATSQSYASDPLALGNQTPSPGLAANHPITTVRTVAFPRDSRRAPAVSLTPSLRSAGSRNLSRPSLRRLLCYANPSVPNNFYLMGGAESEPFLAHLAAAKHLEVSTEYQFLLEHSKSLLP